MAPYDFSRDNLSDGETPKGSSKAQLSVTTDPTSPLYDPVRDPNKRILLHDDPTMDNPEAVAAQVRVDMEERRRLVTLPRRWRLARLGVICCCIFLALAFIIHAFRRVAAEPLVNIGSFVMPVQVLRESTGAWEPLRAEGQLQNGDVVSTGPGGVAHLRFADGSLLKISPNTLVRLIDCSYNQATASRHRVFELYGGRVWARVTRFVSPHSTFIIRTPSVVAHVHGTRFTIAVESRRQKVSRPLRSTSISVMDGEVLAAVPGAQNLLTIASGQEAFAFPQMNQVPTSVPMTTIETSLWDKQQQDPESLLSEPGSPVGEAVGNLEAKLITGPTARVQALLEKLTPHVSSNQNTALAQNQASPGSNPVNFLRSRAAAQTVAEGLQVAMETAYDPSEGYPENIGLSDLSGLGLPPDKAPGLLSQLEGSKLLSYRKVGNDYEIRIQAKSPCTDVLAISQDSITRVPQ